MQIQDNAGRTWLHTAVGTLQVNTVKHILQSLEPESRWLLLNILDKKGENPLDKFVSVDFGFLNKSHRTAWQLVACLAQPQVIALGSFLGSIQVSFLSSCLAL